MVFFQLNVSLSGRLLKDSGSIICETSSPLLLLVWVAKRSIPKMLASFSSLPSIFGYLVLKQRDGKHNWTRHHEKTLYLRTGVHSGSVGLVSIWSLRSLRKKSSAIAAIIWKPLSSDRSDNDRWDTKSVPSQRSLSLRSLERFLYDCSDLNAIKWKSGFI